MSRVAVVLTLALFAATLDATYQPSIAASAYVLGPTAADVGATCASLGGTWDGSMVCTLGGSLSLGEGQSILVDPGAVLALSRGATLADSGSMFLDSGTLINAGSVSITAEGTFNDNGTIDNGPGGSLANSGTLDAYVVAGGITNNGTITNSPGATFAIDSAGPRSPYSGTYFTNSGAFDNGGSFVSYGNLTNTASGVVVNSGQLGLASATANSGKFSAPATVNAGNFTNLAGATLAEEGATFNNTGTLVNLGTFSEQQNLYSVVNNLGMLVNNGTLTTLGFLDNAGGTIENFGTIANSVGCSVVVCGSLSNGGTFVNGPGGTLDNQGNVGNMNTNLRRPELGSFDNEGSVANSGYFVVSAGGSLSNSGKFENYGTLSNMATFNNTGLVNNTAIFLNSGGMTNGPGGSILNARTLTNTGTIENQGSLADGCEGVIEGGGSITGNAVGVECNSTSSAASSTPSTTVTTLSSSSTTAPEFPGWALAPSMLGVIALAAALARRSARKR